MTIIDSREVTGTRIPKPDLPPSMIQRMTLILDSFDSQGSKLSLEEVAHRSRLPRSTTYRILHQLVRWNWVEHSSYGYGLGRRALGLGSNHGYDRIRAAAAPLLHELQLQTGMVVHLAVLDGSDSLYLDKLGGRFATCLPSRVGGHAPAHATAGGKSMLAWLTPEVVDDLYTRPLRRCTERTVAELGALHHELNRIRLRNGLAFDHSESVTGVACAGAAVRGPDGPVAAVSVCGEARSAQLDRVAPLVIDTTREVSRTLFGALDRRTTLSAETNRPPVHIERLLQARTG